MADNFEKNIEALVSGLEAHLSTKTIVGEPIVCGDTTLFPMADVSFGVAAGSFVQEKKNNGAGGAGAKMSPSAILVIQNGTSRIINIKDKDSINKLIDMIPDVVNKISGLFGKQDAAAGPEAE